MTEKTLHEKLVEVQAELKAPKNQKNTFGNYKYRSAEDIIEAVKPLLHSRGLLINIMDSIMMTGNRYYVQAEVVVTDGTKEVITTGLAREAETKKGMDESQITGAASSYARKYALNGMFAIDDTKDADATNDHGKKKPEDGGRLADRPEIRQDMKDLGYDEKVIYDKVMEELSLCTSTATLNIWVAKNKETNRMRGMSTELSNDIKEEYKKLKQFFIESEV